MFSSHLLSKSIFFSSSREAPWIVVTHPNLIRNNQRQEYHWVLTRRVVRSIGGEFRREIKQRTYDWKVTNCEIKIIYFRISTLNNISRFGRPILKRNTRSLLRNLVNSLILRSMLMVASTVKSLHIDSFKQHHFSCGRVAICYGDLWRWVTLEYDINEATKMWYDLLYEKSVHWKSTITQRTLTIIAHTWLSLKCFTSIHRCNERAEMGIKNVKERVLFNKTEESWASWIMSRPRF